MSAVAELAEVERDGVDHAALRLMLSYVEAECLRIGAVDAARHAALAAALVPAPAARPPRGAMRTGAAPRQRSLRLN